MPENTEQGVTAAEAVAQVVASIKARIAEIQEEGLALQRQVQELRQAQGQLQLNYSALRARLTAIEAVGANPQVLAGLGISGPEALARLGVEG